MNTFTQFLISEDGAVTVDWVVLTAAIVGMGIAVLAAVGAGTTDLSSGLGTSLGNATVAEVKLPLAD